MIVSSHKNAHGTNKYKNKFALQTQKNSPPAVFSFHNSMFRELLLLVKKVVHHFTENIIQEEKPRSAVLQNMKF